MISEITTILLGMMIAQNTADDQLVFHAEKTTWVEAQAVCSQDGGTLISDHNQDNVTKLMANISSQVWTGSYYSPWAWLLGCYTYHESFDHIDYIENKDNQMKECLNHCNTTNYFGLQNKKCFCFDAFNGSTLRTIDWCKHVCPGNADERCGGESAITIYMNDICYEESTQWNGTVSQTWSGKQCLPWASIEGVNRTDIEGFPEGSAVEASNFCRDPLGESRLGCYVSPDDWESCDIPPCIKAANDDTNIYPCMSFRKPSFNEIEFRQENCQSDNFAFCVWDTWMFWFHSEGTWSHARDQTRQYFNHFTGQKCKSLAGPRIFWLKKETIINRFHWFGYSREVCTASKTVPNRKPQKCFSLSMENGSVDSKAENCDNTNTFVCRYAPVTCGENFNNSLNGSFETPGYNETGAYGDFKRCVWTITVPDDYSIRLSVNVSTETTYMCRSDFIKIYEEDYDTGEVLCGETSKTINTAGNNVTLEFRSDGTMNDFKGVQVSWSAVPVPTSSTKSTTVTEQRMKQSSNAPAIVELDGHDNSGSHEISVGTLVGVIAGAVVVVGLVLGMVACLIRRKKLQDKKKTKDNSKADVKTIDDNLPSAVQAGVKIQNDNRPVSEIYQNISNDTERSVEDIDYDYTVNTERAKEDVDYDYTESTVNGRERGKAVVMNNGAVSYLNHDGIDGRYPSSEENQEVYNTLHETTENEYQNHTENIYNRFNESEQMYDHTRASEQQSSASNMATSDTQTYDHLNADNYAYAHTSTLKQNTGLPK